ncbi:MAG: ABC transporter permease, partial [Adlercreutzia sp.]|nr:ABC transporter permease [Adlercreutzia sp.]
LAPADLACVLAVELVFVLIPLAIAFLLGQLGCGEGVSNTVGNITGMVLTVLGGTGVSLDLMREAVGIVATFTPVYWLGEGLRAAEGDATGSAAEDVALGVGVLVLFAAAIFVTALGGGRRRAPSDDAGGNAAAAVPRERRGRRAGIAPHSAPWTLCREVRAMRYRLGALLSICSGGELVAQYGLTRLGA